MTGTPKQRTWKFYALIALLDFVFLFVLEMLIEGGYTHWILVHDLVAAVVFAVIIWLVDWKTIKKK